jgi:hypothetical protein
MSPICGNELAKSIIFEQSRVVPMLSEMQSSLRFRRPSADSKD